MIFQNTTLEINQSSIRIRKPCELNFMPKLNVQNHYNEKGNFICVDVNGYDDKYTSPGQQETRN